MPYHLSERAKLRALTCIALARDQLGMCQADRSFSAACYSKTIELLKPYYNSLGINADPTILTISKIWTNFIDEGRISKPHTGGPKKKARDEIEFMLKSHAGSSREIASELGSVCQKTIINAAKELKLRYYRRPKVQSLNIVQAKARLTFCTDLHKSIVQSLIDLNNICFTDECYINLNNISNRQNSGIWFIRGENYFEQEQLDERGTHPSAIMIFTALHPKIGIAYSEVCEGSINAAKYKEIIEKVAKSLQEKLGPDFANCWYQQDGAPAHTAKANIDLLKEKFQGRVISSKAPFSPYQWPPHSPDLNPLDFWFWTALKAIIKRQRPKTRDELELAYHLAITSFEPSDVKKATADLHWRLMACKEQKGWHFEHKFKEFKRHHGVLELCSLCNKAHNCDCGDCDAICLADTLANMFGEAPDLGAALMDVDDDDE